MSCWWTLWSEKIQKYNTNQRVSVKISSTLKNLVFIRPDFIKSSILDFISLCQKDSLLWSDNVCFDVTHVDKATVSVILIYRLTTDINCLVTYVLTMGHSMKRSMHCLEYIKTTRDLDIKKKDCEHYQSHHVSHHKKCGSKSTI